MTKTIVNPSKMNTAKSGDWRLRPQLGRHPQLRPQCGQGDAVKRGPWSALGLVGSFVADVGCRRCKWSGIGDGENRSVVE